MKCGNSVEHIVHIIIDLHPRTNLVEFLHNRDDTFTAVLGKVGNEEFDIVIITLLHHFFGKPNDLRFQLERFGQRRTGIPACLFTTKILQSHGLLPFYAV